MQQPFQHLENGRRKKNTHYKTALSKLNTTGIRIIMQYLPLNSNIYQQNKISSTEILIFRSPVRKKHGKSVSVLRLNTICVPAEP